MKIYFSDFFNVKSQIIEEYGAFDISLINDLPLFIDPFLLFGNVDNVAYQTLHQNILKYLSFLKAKAEVCPSTVAQIKSWYLFPEVKQNWLGYSKVGNGGSGLGKTFGEAFSSSINTVFSDLGKEKITQTTHLEKAALFQIGIGRDNISDFTTNLIKEYLLEYTETFAKQYLEPKYLKKVMVDKVYFNYEFERWMPKEYVLPFLYDYVILTPKNILTKDDNWINANDLRGDFSSICSSLPNDQLVGEVFDYYFRKLPVTEANKNNTQQEITEAILATLKEYPDIISYYIKLKEENKIGAKKLSSEKVSEVENLFIRKLKKNVELLSDKSDFYEIPPNDSYLESMQRLQFFKSVIENNDGYKLFYIDGRPIKRESDLQVIFRLVWYASTFDVNREVNNGRGPVDYIISNGIKDKTLIEFKLASNSKLKQNLKNQVEIYKIANQTNKSIKVVMFFNSTEQTAIKNIIDEFKLEDVVLIDASPKISASNVNE